MVLVILFRFIISRTWWNKRNSENIPRLSWGQLNYHSKYPAAWWPYYSMYLVIKKNLMTKNINTLGSQKIQVFPDRCASILIITLSSSLIYDYNSNHHYINRSLFIIIIYQQTNIFNIPNTNIYCNCEGLLLHALSM